MADWPVPHPLDHSQRGCPPFAVFEGWAHDRSGNIHRQVVVVHAILLTSLNATRCCRVISPSPHLRFHACPAPLKAATASSGLENVRNKLATRVMSNNLCTRGLIPLNTIFRPDL